MKKKHTQDLGRRIEQTGRRAKNTINTLLDDQSVEIAKYLETGNEAFLLRAEMITEKLEGALEVLRKI